MSLAEVEEVELQALLEEEDFQDHVLPRVLNGEPGCPAPLWWMQECTKSYDEKWKAHGFDGPYQLFPKLPYLPWLFHNLQTEERLLIPKSREMLVSWCVIGYGVWLCETRSRTRVIVQTQKEGKAIDLIRGAGVPGYGRTLYEQQSERLKQEFPLTKAMEDQPSDAISWANGSILQGVPSGADQVRLYHPTVIIWDEAAHLEDSEGSWAAGQPVAQQMIAVSSVAPGAFWDWCRRPS
jgi:hypothetical protein